MPDSFKNYMKELSKTAYDTTDIEEDEVETEPSDEDEYQSNKMALFPRLLVDPALGHHHYIFFNSVPGMDLVIERWPNKLDIQATYKVSLPSTEDWANDMPAEHKQCISFPNDETRSFFESKREQTFIIPAPDGTELVESTCVGPSAQWKVITFKKHPAKVGDSGMITL